jgi:fucose 4-O-acetylase-like acetyltransferase
MPTERDCYYDNARFILISLVILLHCFEPTIGYCPELRVFCTVNLFFHMPVFAYVSGRFAKTTSNPENARKTLSKTLVPYFLFYLLYMPVFYVLQKEVYTPFYAFYTLWYLVSLFYWRAFLPYARAGRWGLPIALLIGIGIGYVKEVGPQLSLSRTLVFFPFFLMGSLADIRKYRWFHSPWVRPFAAAFFLVSMGGLWIFRENLGTWYQVFYGHVPYFTLGLDPQWAWAVRTATYVLQFLSSLAFLVLIPEERTWFTHLGTRTMYPYLWHGLFIVLLWHAGLYKNLLYAWQIVAVMVPFAAFMALALPSSGVKKLTSWMVEPAWLAEPSSKPPAGEEKKP